MDAEGQIIRASTPDPDAPSCEHCGGGLAHFPECVIVQGREWQGPYDDGWEAGDRVRDQYDGTHEGTVLGPVEGLADFVLVKWDDPNWPDPNENPSEEYKGDVSAIDDPWRADKECGS
jgi:hypothetical protein